jgi:hypothetical protein
MKYDPTKHHRHSIRLSEPLPYVHTIWESGAAAFGREDEWSDGDFHPSSFFLHP